MYLSRRGFVALAGASSLIGAAPLVIDRAVARPADRLVSIGGAVTEIVCALGAGDRLIAVDSTSYYPPEVQALPDVGYIRRLAAEPIIALQPSLVLALEDAGPPSTIAQLEAAEVPIRIVPDDPTVNGIAQKIRVVADAVGRPGEGRAMSAAVGAELARLDAVIAGVATRPSVLFLLAAGGGGLLAAGDDTSAAGIIALAGGRNAVGGFTGYKPLSAEAAVAAAPDLLLLMNRTLEEIGGHDGVLERPELAVTPAAQAGRIVAMDGLLLLGFGPRTPQAVRQLATALHPDLPLP